MNKHDTRIGCESGSPSFSGGALATRGRSLSRFAAALWLSGFAALTYQVAWQRILTQAIGSDAVSMILVVTIFMVCLGIGSELAKFIVARSVADALRTYAVVEVLVGIYGCASVYFLRTANQDLASFSTDSITLDFLANLALLSAPIIGMGLTTPLIVHVAKREMHNIGRTVGLLYGWNIAGASCGAAITGLVLIEALGLQGSTWLAAGLNVLAAVIALRAFSSIPQKQVGHDLAPDISQPPPIAVSAAASAILFGFSTLAIQVIFFRILSNYLTLSPIVFPMMLCAYLVLMSAGQWIGGRLADRYHRHLQPVVSSLFATGAVLLLAALLLPPTWAAAMRGLRFSSFNGQLVEKTYPELIGDPSPLTVLLFSLVLMMSVVAWSGLFPVMFRLTTLRIQDAGKRFASIYTLYTVGNVLGAFVCGVVMLPMLGTGRSAMVTILIAGTGVLVLLLAKARANATAQKVSWLALSVGIGAASLAPHDYYQSFKLGDYSVIDVFEGRSGVATVVPTSRFYTIVDMNRTASASAMKTDPVTADQYQAWRWNHSELMAIDPQFRPRNILVIGIGHAYLIDAMLDFGFVEKITVVDISSEIVSAVKKYTATSTKRIFSDPRVEIVIADGRRYVQSSIKQGKKFDLIQNKINEPWHAGSSNLFTEEFFLEEKRLLRQNGYLSTRPLIGHLTDGFKIFENAIWGGYYHLYFRNGPAIRPEKAVVTPDIKSAWFAELPGQVVDPPVVRETTSITSFSRLPAILTADASTDDRPTFEYYWLRQLTGTWVSPRVQLSQVDLSQMTAQIPVSVP